MRNGLNGWCLYVRIVEYRYKHRKRQPSVTVTWPRFAENFVSPSRCLRLHDALAVNPSFFEYPVLEMKRFVSRCFR